MQIDAPRSNRPRPSEDTWIFFNSQESYDICLKLANLTVPKTFRKMNVKDKIFVLKIVSEKGLQFPYEIKLTQGQMDGVDRLFRELVHEDDIIHVKAHTRRRSR